MAFTYSLLVEKYSSSRQQHDETCMSVEHLRSLIKEQIHLFPKSRDFDYRNLFADDSDIGRFSKPELLEFLSKITTSNRGMSDSLSSDSPRKRSEHLYPRSGSMELMMASALLSNALDPRRCFIQTLIGLACYAQGLRDKGFKILNAFGVATSVFHIRKHGNFWARMRNAIDEIIPKVFWRVTIDNLDSRIKYAKKLVSGGCGALHLITSQVTFQAEPQRTKPSSVSKQTGSSITPKELLELHFVIYYENSQFTLFKKNTFETAMRNISILLMQSHF